MTFPWLVVNVLVIAAGALVLARVSREYAVMAIVGSAAILLLQHVYFHYTSDDAYISYRYARNFGDGAGLVWNRGEHVEGYSNFLWVAVLAGLHRLGADIVFSARWLGLALAVGCSGLTYRLTRDLSDHAADDERSRTAGLLAALLLAASGVWGLWAAAGLEAPLFALFVLLAVLAHLRERPGADRRPMWRRVPLSGAIWALAAMTRPDGLLLFGISGAFKCVDAAIAACREAGGVRSILKAIVPVCVWAAGFVVIFVPYFAWRYDTYGWLFTNTYYAKVGAGFDQYRRGEDYLVAFLQQYAGWLLLIVPVAISLTSIRRGPAAYVLALVIGWMAYVVFIGGDSLLRFRFFAPIAPLFYALITASIAAIVTSIRSEQRQPRWFAELALWVAVAGALAVTLYPSASDAQGVAGERRAVHDRIEAGRWMRRELPPSTTIAAVPVGALAYESQLGTIDMLGINDEHIAHRDLPLGEFAAGHEKYDSEYVLDRRPDIIILFDGLSSHPWASIDYVSLSGVFIPAIVDMFENPRLTTEYERRTVELGEGMWFNLLVRRGAQAVLAKTTPAPP